MNAFQHTQKKTEINSFVSVGPVLGEKPCPIDVGGNIIFLTEDERRRLAAYLVAGLRVSGGVCDRILGGDKLLDGGDIQYGWMPCPVRITPGAREDMEALGLRFD